MTQLLASDLHIGSGPEWRLADQEASWVSFCTTAADLGAGVLLAGDVFNSRRPGLAEMRAYQRGLERLREGGCTVLGCLGNHDRFTFEAVTAFEVASVGFDVHVSRSPDVVETEDGIVGFLPWSPYSDAREMAGQLLVLAEALRESGARILVAHWALSGGSLPTGLPNLELAEPVLDAHALAAMGFDAVLSGHIHKRQVILSAQISSPPTGEGESHVNGALDSADDRGAHSTGRAPASAPGECLVAHIGPLTRSGFGEADVETGGWSINRIGQNEGSFIEARPFDVPDRTFLSIDVDVRGLISPVGGILEVLGEQDIEGAIVRVTYQVTAEQVVNTAAIVAYLEAEGAHRIAALTPVVERVHSTRSAGVSELTDPRESFDLWWEQQGETASREVLDTVRERAHERIGAHS